MIRIAFKTDATGCPIGIRCLGHAGFARRGKDIVCSAVSALVINTMNSIEAFTEDSFTGEANEKEGYILFELSDSCSDASKLLMRSLELGIRNIYEDNSRFISLIDWEVKSC